MDALVTQITNSIHQFESALLPKLPMVGATPHEEAELRKRLAELKRIAREVKLPPVFSVRFLGDTQNGKSTLINAMLGRKILPEGHVGACSATIVRCRYKKQEKITIEFRYATLAQFREDLDEKCLDAEQAIVEEESEGKRREVVCGLLGRFLKLFGIDAESESTGDLISHCRRSGEQFEEMKLLGTVERIVLGPDTEKIVQENLSARGRRAFIVDECVIEGPFPNWHPAMELVDMPGTNAFNPWDDQVNARLKQKIGGLAIVTKETQLHGTVMNWFKESSILPEIAGASERNQVRVFVLNTFVDKLNLEEDDDGHSKWEQTQEYCGQIGMHIRRQVLDLVHQRYSAQNEIDVLNSFVEGLPIHYLSPKVYRALADDGLRKTVLGDPLKHMDLAAGFQRFDHNPDNTGIPALRQDLHHHTEIYINAHFWTKTRRDFEKEVGQVAHFFRGQRVGIEQRLANQGAFIHEVSEELRDKLLGCLGSHLEATETKVVNLKRHFNEEVDVLLGKVVTRFGGKTRKKLQDWLQLHWASLRCAGRKSGQHITSRGYEIDFNGELADYCVDALNSSWIAHRKALRKQLLDDLRLELIPGLQKVVSQAKGQDPARIDLIEGTYEQSVELARQNLDLTLEQYDAEAEEFDALRPKLALAIRKFLSPTYEGIADESGKGSSVRMRNHLNDGVLRSIEGIGAMVKAVVRRNWEGLAAAVELRIDTFFTEVRNGFNEQAESLTRLAEHPSDGDEARVLRLRELELEIESWLGKEAA